MPKKYLTWIELNKKAFQKNIGTIKTLAGQRLIAAAVKANAYGHGLKEMVRLLADEKVKYLAVHTADEASLARKFGWTDGILVLGYIPLTELNDVLDLNLELTVYNLETVKHLARIAGKLKKNVYLHLKIETGTNRQGVTEDKIDSFVTEFKKHRCLHMKGVSTHFANIEDTTDHSFAGSQLNEFNRIVTLIRKSGIKPKLRHTACSAALLLFEKTKFEMVRPGIALYGLWPSKETYLSYRLEGGDNNILSPLLTWKTRVIQVKEVPSDTFIGYGCTYKTTAKTRLAVLPVGYSDGYDRGLSNLGYVLIKGQRAPIRGRICMNLMMVDITNIKGVRLEEEVILIGKSKNDSISIDQIASWTGSVNYEIASRIRNDIPKLII